MNNTTTQLEVADMIIEVAHAIIEITHLIIDVAHLNIDVTRLRPKQVSIATLFDAQLATCKKLCDKSSATQVGKLNNTTTQYVVAHLNIDTTRLRPKQISIDTLFDAQVATAKNFATKVPRHK